MTTFDMAQVRTYAIDLAERAGNAAWQGALVAAAPVILTTDVNHAISAAWWEQLGAVVLMAAGNSVLSVIKGVFAGVKTGTASLSTQVAQTAVAPGAHAIDSHADPAGFMGIGKAAPVDPPVELPQPGDAIFVADGTDQTGSTP